MRTFIAVLLAAALLPAAALADTSDQTLSVLGRGQVQVTPDVADLSIATDSTAPTAIGARNAVNARTARIVSGILDVGVARSNVTTVDTGLHRVVTRRRHRPALVRWVASSSLSVHVVDLANVSPVFDVATRQGATSFNGPTFGFSNPSAGRAAAEADALRDARARADAAAAQLGLRVIGVRSVDLDPGSGPVPVVAAQGAAGGGAARPTVPTPVEPGTQEVDAQVQVVYLLGQ